jgi:transposase-like protein
MSRIEVMPGPERRRRCSQEQKRAIVAEAFASGASVTEVARRVDVVPGQIYRRRRELGLNDWRATISSMRAANYRSFASVKERMLLRRLFRTLKQMT